MEIAIVIGVIVLGLGGAMLGKHLQNVAWHKAAKKLGLGFQEATWLGHPKVYGKFRDTDVDVFVDVVGAGKNKKVFTVVEAPVSGLAPRGLEVCREGMWQKMGKMIGGEDIQVGDAELDGAFIIKGHDASQITELLTTPSVKRALLVGQRRHQMLRIEYPRVRIRAGGKTMSADRLESYICTVVDVAVSINEACGARSPANAPQVAAEPMLGGAERFGPSEQGANEADVAAAQAPADDNDWW